MNYKFEGSNYFRVLLCNNLNMFKQNCFILFLFCLWTSINGQFFGNDPVKFEVASLTNCAENSPWEWHIKVLTLNDTFVSLTANVTLNSDFDDSLAFSAEFFQMSAKKQQWKKVAKLAKKKTCSFVRSLTGQLFVDITKEMGLPNGNCPVPKGTYKVEDRLIDVQSTPFAKFLTGKFKGHIAGFTPAKDTLFCGEVVFTTTKIH